MLNVINILYLLAMATVTACSVVASAVVVVVDCSSEDECLCLWPLPCLLWSADLSKKTELKDWSKIFIKLTQQL